MGEPPRRAAHATILLGLMGEPHMPPILLGLMGEAADATSKSVDVLLGIE